MVLVLWAVVASFGLGFAGKSGWRGRSGWTRGDVIGCGRRRYIADEFRFGEAGFELDWRGRRQLLLVRGRGGVFVIRDRCCRSERLQQQRSQLMPVNVGLVGSLEVQTEKSFLDERWLSAEAGRRLPKQVERACRGIHLYSSM